MFGPVRLTIAAVYVSKSMVIKRTGSLDYCCRFHPNMAGKVEVSSN
jgi:plastocyanin